MLHTLLTLISWSPKNPYFTPTRPFSFQFSLCCICFFDEVPLWVSNRCSWGLFPKCSAAYARQQKQDLQWGGLVVCVTRFRG
jgi:hypothetical protein